MNKNTVTITISREDADLLLNQMCEYTEFGTVAACETFESALKETK